MPKKHLKWLVFLGVAFLVSAQSVMAATYYVSTTGSDSSPGTCTNASPCSTISKALKLMSGGDTLIVKNGTYTDRSGMLVNDHYSATIPRGSSSAYTTIKAETPYGVRLKWTGGLNYYDSPVSVEQASFVHIDGFIYEFSGSALSEPSYMVSLGSANNKVTRCICKRSHVDAYGGWFSSGGDYNLFEDCAGVGAARYGYYVGGTDANTQYNIFRRCVGRVDFAKTDQPKATFNIYGNNNTTAVQNHLYQNCIAVDGHRPSGGEDKYGAFYHPKNASNIGHYGCIVLNENTGHSGMFVAEWGSGIVVNNSVVWDLTNSASHASGVRANDCPKATFSNLTIGGTIPGAYSENGCSSSGSALGGTHADIVNNTPGAVVMNRYGVDGTRWGETGYNTLTSTSLWPLPGEDAIKAVFSEQMDTPSGYTPANNVSARGFCTGTRVNGQPRTLTSYIWEYLGNKIPDTIYGASEDPSPPARLRLK